MKQACAISACGNFAILGTAGGWIEKFNLQSGIHRGAYVDMSESRSCAHDSEVVGVACDSTNTFMISAGYHGDIKVLKQSEKFVSIANYTRNSHLWAVLQVWDFKGRGLKSRWEIGCSVVKIVYHRYNGNLNIPYFLNPFICL